MWCHNSTKIPEKLSVCVLGAKSRCHSVQSKTSESKPVSYGVTGTDNQNGVCTIPMFALTGLNSRGGKLQRPGWTSNYQIHTNRPNKQASCESAARCVIRENEPKQGAGKENISLFHCERKVDCCYQTRSEWLWLTTLLSKDIFSRTP